MAGRQLSITYVADSSRVIAAQKQIDAGHSRLQTGVQKSSSFFQQAFGVAMPLAAASAAVGVGILAKKVVDAASDQNEALNVVNVTFGRSAGVVRQFGETSAESFGIAKGEAYAAAGGFGAMLKSAGLAEDAAASMSVEVIKLAGDLASFKNVAPEEALEKLRSGLAGEAEPLRTFGVFLSEAAVKAEAYKSGIADVGSELTEAQKVQARYNIILDQTKDAQGDFGRTLGESFPNQMRVLRATLIDTAADLGQQLLPALLDVAKALLDLVEAGRPLLDFLGDVISLSAEAVSALVNIITLNWDELDSGIVETADTMETLLKQFDAGKISALELRDGLNELREESGLNIDITDELAAKIATAEDNKRRAAQAAFEYAKAQEEAAGASGALSQRVRVATQAAQEHIQALRDERLAVLALSDSFLGIADSATAVNEAQRELNRLEQKGKEDTKAYEQAVLDALAAQIGLEDAILSYATELAESGETARTVRQKVRELADQFGVQDDAVEDLISRINTLIGSLNAIPNSIPVHIAVRGPEGLIGGVFAQHGFHGVVRRPTVFVAGEAGAERVDISPRGQGGRATVVVNIGTVVGPGGIEDVAELVRREIIKTGISNGTAGIP